MGEVKSTKKRTARKKSTKSFPPHPLISLGVEEERLLTAISKTNKFNINNYSDMYNIARSTTRSRLKKLNRVGLINYTFANVEILKTGVIYLENIEKVRHESPRARGRKTAKKNELSTHWKKFSFQIIDREKFRKERLNLVKCSWKENTGMKNWSEIIAVFDDVTIIIKPKTLVIELKDLVANEVDEVDSKCLRRVIEYADILKSLGIILGETSIERGHWARVDSLLADIIYKKIGDKYFIPNENGERLFWIDYSPDKTGKRKKEDEVPDKVARKNLDYNITQQLNNQFDFKKIDINEMSISEMKDALGLITEDLGKITTVEKLRLEKEIIKKQLELEEFKSQNQRLERNTIQLNIPSYIN